jgi:drug/metabolite transporter (DMT)-like permease
LSVLYLTILAIAVRIIINPLANVFQKKLIDAGNPPLVINVITYVLIAIVCLYETLQVAWIALPLEFWQNAVLVGIFGAFGNWFYVKALHGSHLSVLGPMNAFKSVIGIIGGIIFLQEMPNIYGLAGLVLIGYGCFFVLDSPDQRFSFSLFRRADIQYRFAGMLLSAFEVIFIKKVILHSSVSISFISYSWFGILFASIFLLASKNQRETTIKLSTSNFILVSLSLGLVHLATNYAIKQLPIGYALSLFQLSALASVLLGYKIFKEDQVVRKLIGATIMIFGSIMIILKG